tara:strand:- start:408 stop:596 length:189 start_codon:yes stop_codon:yes gene_type:complete
MVRIFIREQGPGKNIMKYTTVKISEIAAHPTMRLDPGYWLKKKKIRAKQQAASGKRQAAKKI